jgi:ERCC4-type nuclease
MAVLRVDVREPRPGVPDALDALGIRYESVRLEHGDYAYGAHWAIERKTVRGLHLSVQSGRLWRQLLALRRCGPRPYLLVEGRVLGAGPLPAEAIRSVLLSALDLGVSILASNDAAESASWIERLIQRAEASERTRTDLVLRRALSDPEDPAVAALSAAAGISTVTANALLRRFGSLAGVASASLTDLTALPGIGPKRARALRCLLHNDPE